MRRLMAQGRKRGLFSEAEDERVLEDEPREVDRDEERLSEMDRSAIADGLSHGDSKGERHVVKFRGRDVAVGLVWKIVADPGAARQAAADESKAVNTDLWCLKTDGDPQVGLGSTVSGHKRGMPALAAEIAGMTPGEWAGIFEIDSYYYVLSARNGTIDPESDVALGSFEEARVRYVDLCSRDVSKFYASPGLIDRDLGVVDVEALDLDSMGIPFAVKLQALSAIPGAIGGFVRAVIGVGILVGLAFAFPAQFQRVKEFVGLAHKAQIKRVVVPPMPWTGQPKPRAMLDRCLDAFAVAPRDAAGWAGKKLVCDGRHVALDVRRSGSVTDDAAPIGWLEQWVNEAPVLRDRYGEIFGKPKIAGLKASGATIVWNLGTLPRWKDSDRPDAKLDVVRHRLWFEAEKRFLHSTFKVSHREKYWMTERAEVEAGMDLARDFGAALNVKTETLSSVTLDLASGEVLMDIRYHAFLGFPRGKNIVVARLPNPASLEGARLPPPEK